MNYPTELYHHGVLGMHWGVHRSRSLSSSSRSRSQKKRKGLATEKTTHEMSDEELRSKINRLQMEKTYAALTAKQQSPAVKWISDVVSTAAKQTATTYVAKFMSKGMDAIISKSGGDGNSKGSNQNKK